MKSLPQRVSLVSQTADILRERIAAGAWTTQLPGERELCAQLRISRPTLRAALDALQREGALSVSQGRRRAIRPTESPGQTHFHTASTVVAFLTPSPLHRLPPFVMFWVNDLRERLAEAGLHLEVKLSRAAEHHRPSRLLENVVRTTRAAAWILFVSTEPMQRWFVARNLPCVVTGSRFPGVTLPAVDVNYRAASRHAAGHLLALGHRRLALVLPSPATGGDLATELGFMEGCAARSDSQAILIRHDESAADLCRRVSRALAAADPVTAMLVARSAHALTVFTHCLSRGRQVPGDISLISRNDDAFLDYTQPRLTRYGSDPAAFARNVSRIVLKLARTDSAPARETLLMPRFIRGETTGQLVN